MTDLSLSLDRDRRVTIIGVVGFAAALAAASQVAIPIPGTVVPITLQPLAVVLAGLWLDAEGSLDLSGVMARGRAGPATTRRTGRSCRPAAGCGAAQGRSGRGPAASASASQRKPCPTTSTSRSSMPCLRAAARTASPASSTSKGSLPCST